MTLPGSSETDAAVAGARAASDRVRGRGVATVQRRGRRGRGGRRPRLIAAAAVCLVALLAGSVFGLGAFALVAVLAGVLALLLLIFFAPATPVPSPERLAQSELKALPAQTTRWLDAQRTGLPPLALPLIDRIDRQLDTLGLQLGALDDDSPAALDVRRLVGEQLPGFVRDYQRVPPAMRRTPHNGKTPDQQLVDGLGVIEREIGEMSQQMAQGDLDTLATRGRFLEIKYEGERTQ